MGKLKAAILALLIGSAAQADERDTWLFAQWTAHNQTRPFRQMLVDARLYGVVPIHQLLRSASDWRLCHAEPFAVPPLAQWPDVRSTLRLLDLLRSEQVLGPFEVVSAYRNPTLNRCAGGAANSAHTRAFAVDLLLASAADAQKLCGFWQRYGEVWNMGLGRYPSGRIHLDTAGYRTWGADFGPGSSFCPRLSATAH